ncbi:unnamed protein product [Amoebophrya sp. A25]|nr:unnamed protein product [Amoebophrya sp. A25]|eukprot:GSA25T00023804001.1
MFAGNSMRRFLCPSMGGAALLAHQDNDIQTSRKERNQQNEQESYSSSALNRTSLRSRRIPAASRDRVFCEQVRRGEVANWSGTRRSIRAAETVVVNDVKDLTRFVCGSNKKLAFGQEGSSPSGLQQGLGSPTSSTSSTSKSQKKDYPGNFYLKPLGACLSPNGCGIPNEVQETAEGAEENFIVEQEQQGSLSSRGSPIVPQMLSCEKLSSISIAPDRKSVTCGAGCTVQQLLDTLSEEGLTLSNFSSVTDQTLAGWTQLGAHGTGIFDSTVDEMVLAMDVVTPEHGLIHVSRRAGGGSGGSGSGSGNRRSQDQQQSLFDKDFDYFKCGLGLFGVVASLTMKVVPRFTLQESTYVLSREELVCGHQERLRRHQHVRYHWVPHTDAVVVTVCDPVDAVVGRGSAHVEGGRGGSSSGSSRGQVEHDQKHDSVEDGEEPEEPTFTAEREEALARDPLNWENVKQTNEKEVEFWRNSIVARGKAFTAENASSGSVRERDAGEKKPVLRDDRASAYYHWNLLGLGEKKKVKTSATYFTGRALQRTGDSTEILGFNCGCSQQVLEVCFKVNNDSGGRSSTSKGSSSFFRSASLTRPEDALDNDLHYVFELLDKIERQEIPAPAPIEQRYTRASTSKLSPCYSPNPDDLFTWVGVIMYRIEKQAEGHKDSKRDLPVIDSTTTEKFIRDDDDSEEVASTSSAEETQHVETSVETKAKKEEESTQADEQQSNVSKIDAYFPWYAGQHLGLCLRYGGVCHWGKIPLSYERELFPLAKTCVSNRYDLAEVERVKVAVGLVQVSLTQGVKGSLSNTVGVSLT